MPGLDEQVARRQRGFPADPTGQDITAGLRHDPDHCLGRRHAGRHGSWGVQDQKRVDLLGRNQDPQGIGIALTRSIGPDVYRVAMGPDRRE